MLRETSGPVVTAMAAALGGLPAVLLIRPVPALGRTITHLLLGEAPVAMGTLELTCGATWHEESAAEY